MKLITASARSTSCSKKPRHATCSSSSATRSQADTSFACWPTRIDARERLTHDTRAPGARRARAAAARGGLFHSWGDDNIDPPVQCTALGSIVARNGLIKGSAHGLHVLGKQTGLL